MGGREGKGVVILGPSLPGTYLPPLPLLKLSGYSFTKKSLFLSQNISFPLILSLKK